MNDIQTFWDIALEEKLPLVKNRIVELKAKMHKYPEAFEELQNELFIWEEALERIISPEFDYTAATNFSFKVHGLPITIETGDKDSKIKTSDNYFGVTNFKTPEVLTREYIDANKNLIAMKEAGVLPSKEAYLKQLELFLTYATYVKFSNMEMEQKNETEKTL